jgi:formyl-CoA transferase
VLDLTRLPAVYATRLLAEQGYHVIRVEAPSGDDVRRLGPFLGESPDLEGGAYHQFFNSGKRSLALDTTGPDGRARPPNRAARPPRGRDADIWCLPEL